MKIKKIIFKILKNTKINIENKAVKIFRKCLKEKAGELSLAGIKMYYKATITGIVILLEGLDPKGLNI